MTTFLESAIVRIRAINGTVVGTGFLVTGRHVLTCAHVVASALGLPHRAPNPPQADLHLDFPLLAPESVLTARLSHWQPAIDVAVLELISDPPAESKPVRLVTADDLWGHSFRALGFSAGYGGASSSTAPRTSTRPPAEWHGSMKSGRVTASESSGWTCTGAGRGLCEALIQTDRRG